MDANTSLRDWERGSHLVAYFAQYSMTFLRDTIYFMSTLARTEVAGGIQIDISAAHVLCANSRKQNIKCAVGTWQSGQ